MFENWLILMWTVLPLLFGLPLPAIILNTLAVFIVGWKLNRKWILFSGFALLEVFIYIYLLFPTPVLLNPGYHEIQLNSTSFSKPSPQGFVLTQSGPFILKDSRTNALFLPSGTMVWLRCNASRPWHGRQILQVIELKTLRPASLFLRVLSDIRKSLHNKIQTRTLHTELAALLEGLILGNRSYLEYGVLKSFQMTGIAHLLALSGLHVGIVSLLILFLFKPIFGEKPALFLASGAVLFYMVFSGLSSSILRAGLMFLLSNILILVGRPARWQDIAGSVGMLLIFLNPNVLTQPGYWLSFGAVIGIVTTLRFFEQGLSVLPKSLRSWTAVSFSAQWGTFSPQLLWFGSFSPLSLLANPIIVPLFSALTYGLFFYFFLILFPLSSTLRFLLEWPLFALWKLIHILSSSLALFGFLNWNAKNLSLILKTMLCLLVLVWPVFWLRRPIETRL